MSEKRNKRIEGIASAFGKRIVTYVDQNKDNVERTTIFTPDTQFDARRSGNLQHGYSNPDSGNGFILSANAIMQPDGSLTHDRINPSVGVLMDGPYDGDYPTRNVYLSKFRSLPDQAKDTWDVDSSVAYSNRAPSHESSNFMWANSLTPDQLREIEDKAFKTFGQLSHQGGVPE